MSLKNAYQYLNNHLIIIQQLRQANLNKGIRTLNPQEIFNDDFRDAFRQSAAVYQFRHI